MTLRDKRITTITSNTVEKISQALPAKTDIKLTVNSHTSATECDGRLFIILVDD